MSSRATSRRLCGRSSTLQLLITTMPRSLDAPGSGLGSRAAADREQETGAVAGHGRAHLEAR
jgi:hypothetical protein